MLGGKKDTHLDEDFVWQTAIKSCGAKFPTRNTGSDEGPEVQPNPRRALRLFELHSEYRYSHSSPTVQVYCSRIAEPIAALCMAQNGPWGIVHSRVLLQKQSRQVREVATKNVWCTEGVQQSKFKTTSSRYGNIPTLTKKKFLKYFSVFPNNLKCWFFNHFISLHELKNSPIHMLSFTVMHATYVKRRNMMY